MIIKTDNPDDLKYDIYTITEIPGDMVYVSSKDLRSFGTFIERSIGEDDTGEEQLLYVPTSHRDRSVESLVAVKVYAVGDNCPDWIKEADTLAISSNVLRSTTARSYNAKSGASIMWLGHKEFQMALTFDEEEMDRKNARTKRLEELGEAKAKAQAHITNGVTEIVF